MFERSLHRSPEEPVNEALDGYLSHIEELADAVRAADEQFERGEFLSHEEMVAQFGRHFVKA